MPSFKLEKSLKMLKTEEQLKWKALQGRNHALSFQRRGRFPEWNKLNFEFWRQKKRNQNALNRSKCKKMFFVVVVVAVFETLLSKVVTNRNLISPRWRNVFVPDFSAKKLVQTGFLSSTPARVEMLIGWPWHPDNQRQGRRQLWYLQKLIVSILMKLKKENTLAIDLLRICDLLAGRLETIVIYVTEVAFALLAQ